MFLVIGKHDVGNLSHSHQRPSMQGRYGSHSQAGQSSQSVRSSRSNILSGGE